MGLTGQAEGPTESDLAWLQFVQYLVLGYFVSGFVRGFLRAFLEDIAGGFR